MINCAQCGVGVTWPAGEVVQRDSHALRFDLICDECASETNDQTLAEYQDDE